MKTINSQTRLILVIMISISLILIKNTSAQQSSFSLTNSGGTLNYMKYSTKLNKIHGIDYTQGYIGIGAPVAYQMLHIAGGNILLTNSGGNPSCFNGAVLFGANYDSINSPAGEWGIEYETLESGGGLNFWKPYPTSNYGSYFLFLKNNGNVGIGTGTPATKLQVNGDVTISPLINTTGRLMLTTDATGKLMLTDKIGGADGDNMGNCIADRDVILGNNMLVGSAQNDLRYGPNGELWQEGLKFIENTSGKMALNSFSKATLIAGSLLGEKSVAEDGDTRFWAVNSSSGGIGIGLLNIFNNENKRIVYNGIFTDMNDPKLAMTFSLDGNIGIGTNEPSKRLEVVGDIALTGGIYGQPIGGIDWQHKLQLHGSINTNAGYIELGDGSTSWNKVKIGAPGEDGTIQLWADDKKSCITVRSHEVVFGDPDVGNTVDIKVIGKIFATEVKVSLESWQDIVFVKAYKLMPLPE